MKSLLKYTSVALGCFLLVACSGQPVKKQVAAKVKSEIIEIPQAAANDFTIAVKLLGEGKVDLAQKKFEHLVAAYPQLAGPYANLGVIYAKQEKWSNAENALIKATQKNRKSGKLLAQLGYVYRQQGKFADAEKVYKKAIKVDPAYQPAYLNLGILYDIYMGKLDSAAKQYQAYQKMQTKPDTKVAGWLVDLKRRVNKKGQLATGGQ